MRYNDLFNFCFELDDRCNNFKIPKLILQPLAENAIYHGIRKQSEMGLILLKTKYIDGIARIELEDSGIGMTESELDNILHNNDNTDKLSFGLNSTIKRLQIFYGCKNCIKVESQKGIGTKITILIKI
jgi:two-component system sensor histidine kinase YesM